MILIITPSCAFLFAEFAALCDAAILGCRKKIRNVAKGFAVKGRKDTYPSTIRAKFSKFQFDQSFHQNSFIFLRFHSFLGTCCPQP